MPLTRKVRKAVLAAFLTFKGVWAALEPAFNWSVSRYDHQKQHVQLNSCAKGQNVEHGMARRSHWTTSACWHLAQTKFRPNVCAS